MGLSWSFRYLVEWIHLFQDYQTSISLCSSSLKLIFLLRLTENGHIMIKLAIDYWMLVCWYVSIRTSNILFSSIVDWESYVFCRASFFERLFHLLPLRFKKTFIRIATVKYFLLKIICTIVGKGLCFWAFNEKDGCSTCATPSLCSSSLEY